MKRAIGWLSGGAILGAAMASPVLAQNFSLAPMIMQSVVLNPCPAGTACGDAAAGRSTPNTMPGMPSMRARPMTPSMPRYGAPVTTRYIPSPAVSAQVKAQFIQDTGRRIGPQAAQRLSTQLADKDVVAIWARGLASYGLRPDDVADAFTSYWVLNWSIANRSDSTPAQMQGVRSQVLRIMSTGPLSHMSNEGRQKLAETAILYFLTQSVGYEYALKSHNAELQAKISDAAEQLFRTDMKIDLRTLRLTDAGFLRKG